MKTIDQAERDLMINCARVYLAEARRRRCQQFGFTLLEWAGNKRREVMQMIIDARTPSPQMDLFA